MNDTSTTMRDLLREFRMLEGRIRKRGFAIARFQAAGARYLDGTREARWYSSRIDRLRKRNEKDQKRIDEVLTTRQTMAKPGRDAILNVGAQ